MNYDRIKKLRESTGMSARKFAEAIDMKYTTYYGYENGVSEPNSAVIVKLCSYFGCTADYLLGLSDDPKGYFDEKETSPAPAEAETGEVTREMSIQLLKALGLLDKSGNLSDDDLAFLGYIVGLLEWRFGDHS
jgi:transcriptional regulator with XRE-family HTH domain